MTDLASGCSPDRCAVVSSAAALMSLIQSAELNGHDPYAYLSEMLARLPTHKVSAVNE